MLADFSDFIVEATTYIPEPSSTSEAPVNVTEISDGDGLPTWIGKQHTFMGRSKASYCEAHRTLLVATPTFD